MSNKKQYILKIATHLFLNYGYKGVSLNDIVKASKISKGGLYNYFDSKEQLFAVSITTLLDIIIKRRKEAIINKDFPSLRVFYHNYVDYIFSLIESDIVDENSLGNLFKVICDALDILPKFRQKMQEIYDEMCSKWVKVIDKAKISNEITTTTDSQNLAKIFMNLEQGVSTDYTIKLLTHSDAKNELIKNMDILYQFLK